MNRVHVHLNVPDLEEARRYYTALLGNAPTVEQPDYLQWKLSDPAINLSVVADEPVNGLVHLGLDLDSSERLEALHGRMTGAGLAAVPEAGAHCCYARSDKQWLEDPAGVAWEAFHTYGEGTRLHGPSGDSCRRQAEARCCG